MQPFTIHRKMRLLKIKRMSELFIEISQKGDIKIFGPLRF